MKWIVVLLIFLGLLGLWRMGGVSGEKSKGGNELRLSERRVLDRSWRKLPEAEMTIEEMERYAAGLSDAQLWSELEKCYDDWLVMNRGRKSFYQPRLAIMLAREIGKRDGELGMKAVASWLNADEDELDPLEEDALEIQRQRQFGDLRILMAGYAGWVSEQPEEAIGRLIESRKNEEADWPVLNSGFMMYFEMPVYYAAEEVVRDGFQRIMKQDREAAQRLLIDGTKIWAFDPLMVGTAVFTRFFEIEKEEFWEVQLSDEPEMSVIDLVKGISARLYRRFPLTGTEDLSTYFSDDTVDWSLGALNLLALTRPSDVREILERDFLSADEERDLVMWMGARGTENYELINEVVDQEKVKLVDSWIAGAEYWDFGPLTGKENSGSLDIVKLREVIERAEMSDEVRGQIEELLDQRGE